MTMAMERTQMLMYLVEDAFVHLDITCCSADISNEIFVHCLLAHMHFRVASHKLPSTREPIQPYRRLDMVPGCTVSIITSTDNACHQHTFPNFPIAEWNSLVSFDKVLTISSRSNSRCNSLTICSPSWSPWCCRPSSSKVLPTYEAR